MINIGDRVAYDDGPERGTVVEPTKDEAGDGSWEMGQGDVLVAWDHGARYWEDPDELVVVRGAGS